MAPPRTAAVVREYGQVFTKSPKGLSKLANAQTDSSLQGASYINPGMVYELCDAHSLGGLSFQ